MPDLESMDSGPNPQTPLPQSPDQNCPASPGGDADERYGQGPKYWEEYEVGDLEEPPGKKDDREK